MWDEWHYTYSNSILKEHANKVEILKIDFFLNIVL